MTNVHPSTARATLTALLLAAAGSAWACGLENPYSVASQRGMMNLAFPQSAWVRTAIWQAQMDGELPRDPAPRGADFSPQGIASLQLMRATGLLQLLARRLDTQPHAAQPPALSVVLMGAMLWTRMEPQAAGGWQTRVHVAGPEAGDVVIVTDTPAVEAIAVAGMGFERAIELGLVRLYGPEAQVVAARTLLNATP